MVCEPEAAGVWAREVVQSMSKMMRGVLVVFLSMLTRSCGLRVDIVENENSCRFSVERLNGSLNVWILAVFCLLSLCASTRGDTGINPHRCDIAQRYYASLRVAGVF